VAISQLATTYANNLPSTVSVSQISELAEAISYAEQAIDISNNLLYTNYGTDDEEPVSSDTTYTYSQISGILSKILKSSTLSMDNLSGDTLTISGNSTDGVMYAVANFAGEYTATAGAFTLDVQSGTTDGYLSSIDLSGLTAPDTGTTTTATDTAMTDIYGYVIDLAFRTNVAGSSLQLQTSSVDRIYTDGAGATAGSGSYVSYTFDTGLNDTQVRGLLAAIRLVFFDPSDGNIYAEAALGDATISGETATAEIYLKADDGTLKADMSAITSLEQSVAKKVSVLVYLDGTNLSNTSVFNGANSGTLTLNLQFSSSAQLVPMDDNDLKSATSADSYAG
jgi:hypothetical protein